MSQSLVKNLIHLVYSTKNCNHWIPKECHKKLFAYQAGIFRELESPVIIIGGAETTCIALFAFKKSW